MPTPGLTNIGNGMSYLDPYWKISTPVTPSNDIVGNQAQVYTVDADLTHRFSENSNLRIYAQYMLYDFPNEQQTNWFVTAPNQPWLLSRYDNYEFYYNQSIAAYADYLYTLKTKFLVDDFQAGFDYKVFYNQEAGSSGVVPGYIDLRNPSYANDVQLYAESGAYPEPSQYPVAPHLQSNFEYNVFTFSYYAENRIHLLKDMVQLIGGLRWYSNKEIDEDYNGGTSADNSKPPTRDWKMGAVFKPLPSVSLYVDHTINTIPLSGYIINYNPDGSVAQVIPYKDQEGILTEGGLKWNHIFNETFSTYGNFAIFDMGVTNVRTFNPVNSFVYQSGLTTSKGWDLDAGTRMTVPGGTFDLLFTYEKDKTRDGSTGIVAVSAAPWSWSGVGKYSVTGGLLKGAWIGTGWKDEGLRLQRSYFIQNPVVGTAFVGYSFLKHWSCELNVDNLTNQLYLIVAANGGSYGIAQVSRPRTERFTTTYKW